VSMRSALMNNLTLKLAALVLAVMMWLFAKGEQTAERVFPLPLVVRDVPEGVTTVERVPESISVVVTGANKELVRLRFWGDPYAFVDMSDAEPGRAFRVSLSAGNVVLPPDVAVQVLEIRRPKNLDFEIDRLAERGVAVVPLVMGELADSYHILGRARSVPDTVTVYGPAGVLEDLAAVRTAPVSIAGRRSKIEMARRIEFDGPWNLHAVPKEVRVQVDVEGTEVGTFSGIPVTFEREPGFAVASVEPQTAEIEVTGPEHLVTFFDSEDALVIVDARGLPRGNHHLVPEIHLPEGLTVRSVRPERFVVTLE